MLICYICTLKAFVYIHMVFPNGLLEAFLDAFPKGFPKGFYRRARRSQGARRATTRHAS